LPVSWFASFCDPRDVVGGKAFGLAHLSGVLTGCLDAQPPVGFVIRDKLARLLSAGCRWDRPGAPGWLESAQRTLEQIGRRNCPHELLCELAKKAQSLGARSFCVRSSFFGEDNPRACAPGVYESVVDVPLDDLPAAIVKVVASAFSPAALAYANAQGWDAWGAPLSVVVHGFVPATAHGHAAVTADAQVAVDLHSGALPPAQNARLRRILKEKAKDLLRPAALLDATCGVEIEWVLATEKPNPQPEKEATDANSTNTDFGSFVFVQWRPLPAQPAAPVWSAHSELPGDPQSWIWDAAHNPQPLSPAQQGLVEHVAQCPGSGVELAVAGGYLFSRNSGNLANKTPIEQPELSEQKELAGLLSLDASNPMPRLHELQLLVDSIDRELGPVGGAPVEATTELSSGRPSKPEGGTRREDLEAALRAFRQLYPLIVGQLGKTVRAFVRQARSKLEATGLESDQIEALLTAAPTRATQRRMALQAIARGEANAVTAFLATFGDESPAWDVARQTWLEDPRSLHALRSSRYSRSREVDCPESLDEQHPKRAPASGARSAPGTNSAAATSPTPGSVDLSEPQAALVTQAQMAMALGEEDDWLYARLQARVRRALVGIGRTLHAKGQIEDSNDVFFLSFATVRAQADGARALDLKAEVSANRRLFGAHAQSPPPLPPFGTPTHQGATFVSGHGVGGRVVARVHRHISGAPPPPANRVVVARTLLPTELPLLNPSALIVETGGPLGHVAAQARERGFAALVGASGCDQLRSGDLVLVDGVSGHAIRIQPGNLGTNRPDVAPQDAAKT